MDFFSRCNSHANYHALPRKKEKGALRLYTRKPPTLGCTGILMASGTPSLPFPIALTRSVLELKLVGANPISILTRSYTTYADRRKVSPSTLGDPLAVGRIPNIQRAVPLANVAGGNPGAALREGKISSLKGTDITTPLKEKSRV